MSMTGSMKLTDAQERALKAADEKGGAWHGRRGGSSMGGAWLRMCESLAARGLVEDRAPFLITDAGRASLAALKAERREKAYRRGEAWAVIEVIFEQKDKATNCPFCGSGVEIEPWHGGEPTKVMISCRNERDTCEVGPAVTGEDIGEALGHWNTRA